MTHHTRWRDLLARSDSIESLALLTGTMGFGTSHPLDRGTREALGIPDDALDVRVASGVGATRALLLRLSGTRSMKDDLARIAAPLSARSPHLLWLAVVTSDARQETAIATWNVEAGRNRVQALIVRRAQVLASDIDTVEVLAATEGSDLERHARWRELLGREALSRRFYVTLERLVTEFAEGGRAGTESDRREVVLLQASRLIFLAYLETKGWLDRDRSFLVRVFDDCQRSDGRFSARVLRPLFFGTLNTPARQRAPAARRFGDVPFLNGGLFQRSALERRTNDLSIDDGQWARFYDELLERYRFTAREETSDWSEAAIDPDMLGRAFESLMASRDRRTSGAFFTPQSLVERVTTAAFDHAFPVTADAAESARRLQNVRLLDPACGSGAFLVHALDRLTNLRRQSGDARPSHHIRRQVLTENLFGVDVNPTAVWLCELRLWLAVVIDCDEEDPRKVEPLPNLDHNIRCGDSLSGGDFSYAVGQSAPRLLRLRTRYARSYGSGKRIVARVLEREERTLARNCLETRLVRLATERRALLLIARGRDLFGARRGSLAGERSALLALRARTRDVRRQLRALAAGGATPFAFASHFPDVAVRGGFDIVIGNPPWVRVHRISLEDRERWRREFVVYRDAAWEAGARDARAGRGFSAQIDLSSLFVERGLALTRPAGVLGFLVPAKLWRSLAGGGVRQLLQDRTELRVLEDWSDAPSAFDAVVYPALVVANRRCEEGVHIRPAARSATHHSVRITARRGSLDVSWCAGAASLPLDESRGAPWLLLPPDARAAFERLSRDGVPLVESGVGRPTLGVKCGCNDAFIVQAVREDVDRALVRVGKRTGTIESMFVRPALRGECVRAWRPDASDERIVFPHETDGRPLRSLPPGVRAWLQPFRTRLLDRSDLQEHGRWWSLFRIAGAASDRPRVVWADMGRAPHALVLPAGDRTVAINTCYVVRCRDDEDAFALAALLNSAIVAAWLNAIAEPARGGYRRYFAWTVARLPLPDDWYRARDVLGPIGRRAWNGEPPARAELLDAALDAYRLKLATISPLLGWMSG